MTKILLPKYNLPLGRVVKDYVSKDSRVRSIGLMNICPIPMQKSAYPQEVVSKYVDFLNVLERLRKPRKRLTNEEEELKALILHYFENELQKLHNRKCYIIPCGKTAQHYFSCVSVSSPWKVIENIPHPSFGNWSREKYKENIEDLREKFAA